MLKRPKQTVAIDHIDVEVEHLLTESKKYSSALKQVVSPMSNDASELPQFFEDIEVVFDTFDVPEDLKAKLLLPFLSQKAKTLTARLTAEELDDYGKLKDFLLSEFKLTPREYKAHFDMASKQADETYIYFAARLRNYLCYYLRSRSVNNSYDRLCDLLISDKLKSCLPNGPLNYVLALEGGEWFDPRHVAELADTYVSNHTNVTHSKFVGYTNTASKQDSPRKSGQRFPVAKRDVNRGSGHGNRIGQRSPQTQTQTRRCYRCQSSNHLVRFCPRARETVDNSDHGHADQTQVNACYTCVSDASVVPTVCGRKGDNVGTDVMYDMWEFGEFPETSDDKNSVDIQLSPLQFIELEVDGVSCKGLCDSGAQIPVISKALFEQINAETCGHVQLQGVIGEAVRSPLSNVVIKPRVSGDCANVAQGLQVVCAVAHLNNVNHDVILPTSVVQDIQQLPVVSVMNMSVVNSNKGYMNDDIDDDANDENRVDDVDWLSVKDEIGNEELAKEQCDGPSLKSC